MLAADSLAPFRRPGTPTEPRSAAEQAMVAVGRTLFFDPTLFISGTTSCASCHNPALAWRDGRARPPDRAGNPLPRHAPTLFNLSDVPALLWDGRMNSLEAQAIDPILNPRIGGLTPAGLAERVSNRLERDEAFAASFRAAFGDTSASVARVGTAIAAFERTLVSPVTPFDRWAAGDGEAVSPAAKRGFAVFVGKGGCASCHTGWRFTDDGFHDVGMPDADLGIGARLPGEPTLQHAFKTPTLRETLRGPYMHDGSRPTLDAVLDHYDGGFVRRPSLDPDMRAPRFMSDERVDLLAFLKTLSSQETE